MGQFTTCRVSEASATELGTQNAPGKAPVRAQRRAEKGEPIKVEITFKYSLMR